MNCRRLYSSKLNHLLFLHNNKGLYDVFVSTETSWQTISEAINGIDPSMKETAFTKLEELIDVSVFKEGLNAEQQEKILQSVGLTGWKDQLLKAIDEVRLVCV